MALVTVKVRDNGTFAWMKNLGVHVIRIGNKEAWNLTQAGAKLMRTTHLETSEAWKGHVRRGIVPLKLAEGSYGIEFSKAAIGLDRMQPHWVALKRGRLITQWAKDRGVKGGAVFVTPHPYIEAGYIKMLNRLDIIVNRILKQVEA